MVRNAFEDVAKDFSCVLLPRLDVVRPRSKKIFCRWRFIVHICIFKVHLRYQLHKHVPFYHFLGKW